MGVEGVTAPIPLPWSYRPGRGIGQLAAPQVGLDLKIDRCPIPRSRRFCRRACA